MHANSAPHSDTVDLTQAERRSAPRFLIADLELQFRLKGSLRRRDALVLDFNRFGLAMQTVEPQPLNRHLYLKLRHPELSIANVVGIVHNCVRGPDGYRCGIQFRPDLKIQSRAEGVKRRLAELEARLAFADSSEPA